MSCDCSFSPLPPSYIDPDTQKTISFGLHDLDNIEIFFRQHGFVVVDNVASTSLIDALCAELDEIAGLTGVDDLETFNWLRAYGSGYNTGKGFVGMMPAIGPAATDLRQDEGVLALYGRLLGRHDLNAKLDRFGLMRPTDKHPEWKTENGFVHWDQNPWVEPLFSRVQGLLTLTEHTATSGGFHCVPDFCQHFEAYADAHPQGPGDQSDLVRTKGACLRERHLQRVLASRGSLILWDSRTPHGNWPNQGTSEWRKVLYITFFPQPEEQHLRDLRKAEFDIWAGIQPMIQCLNASGRRLFSLDPYPDDLCVVTDVGLDVSAPFSNRQNGLP